LYLALANDEVKSNSTRSGLKIASRGVRGVREQAKDRDYREYENKNKERGV